MNEEHSNINEEPITGAETAACDADDTAPQGEGEAEAEVDGAVPETEQSEECGTDDRKGSAEDLGLEGKAFDDADDLAQFASTEEIQEEKKETIAESVYEWVEILGYALAVMMILFLFVFKYVSVDGASMSPTFNANLMDNDTTNDTIEDRLIITNFMYTPKTGDVIVVTSENHEKPLIKRVIAVGGQTVKINFSAWEVWVDGVLLDESEYLIEGMNYRPDEDMNNGSFQYNEVEFTVEEGKVFVMGDNRQNSLDSRFSVIGQLRIDDIMGKVIARVYPLSKIKWFG